MALFASWLLYSLFSPFKCRISLHLLLTFTVFSLHFCGFFNLVCFSALLSFTPIPAPPPLLSLWKLFNFIGPVVPKALLCRVVGLFTAPRTTLVFLQPASPISLTPSVHSHRYENIFSPLDPFLSCTTQLVYSSSEQSSQEGAMITLVSYQNWASLVATTSVQTPSDVLFLLFCPLQPKGGFRDWNCFSLHTSTYGSISFGVSAIQPFQVLGYLDCQMRATQSVGKRPRLPSFPYPLYGWFRALYGYPQPLYC